MDFEIDSPQRIFLKKLGYVNSSQRPILLVASGNAKVSPPVTFDINTEPEAMSIVDDILACGRDSQ